MTRGHWIGIVAIVVVVLVALLAIGTLHRDDCIKAHEVGCSLVPWSGHYVPVSRPSSPYG